MCLEMSGCGSLEVKKCFLGPMPLMGCHRDRIRSLQPVSSVITAVKERHPDIAPEDLGSMGYAGEEAVFVSRQIVEEAYEDSEKSLNWYRSYNASRSSAKKYFNSVLDLPTLGGF